VEYRGKGIVVTVRDPPGSKVRPKTFLSKPLNERAIGSYSGNTQGSVNMTWDDHLDRINLQPRTVRRQTLHSRYGVVPRGHRSCGAIEFGILLYRGRIAPLNAERPLIGPTRVSFIRPLMGHLPHYATCE